MNKILSLMFLVFINALGFSQLSPIANKINDFRSKKERFVNVNPFTLDETSNKQAKYTTAATDAKVLKLESSELNKIVASRPFAIEMSLPYNGSEVTVELVQNDIFGGKELIVNTDKGLYKDYKPGVYYQGIVKGNNKSVVAVSFFEDDIVGVVSLANGSNIIIGKAISSDDFVIYTDSKLTGVNPFICKADELMKDEKEKISLDLGTSKAPKTDNVVRVYYEVCFNPFVQNGRDSLRTVNWMTAVHNIVALLYDNAHVRTALSEVFVWTTPDPYNNEEGSSNLNLSDFRRNRTRFNGDLAHLINVPRTSSIAYLNSLCTPYRYAYSGVNIAYNDIQVYSWTVFVIAHEMGHSLGSPHTHACVWNGNNTAIDGCAAPQGGCDAGPIPASGTIMSYCHLQGGIDFALGFGVQPRNLIHETVDSRPCLNNNLLADCPATISGLDLSNNNDTATIIDDISTRWRYKIVRVADDVVIKDEVTVNRVLNLSELGLQLNTNYELRVKVDCGNEQSYQISQIFLLSQRQSLLTGTNRCSETFKSPNLKNGHYGNDQLLIKTFYPDRPNQKLKITFNKFDLEDKYDFLTLRNGPSVTSPIFAGAVNMSGKTMKGPFESTHETGAITAVFKSDRSVTAEGWIANFSCKELSTSDIKSKDIYVSPNPTNGPIDIKTSVNIDQIAIVDSSGKIVNVINNLQTKEKSIDLSSYPTGTYIITVKSGNDTVVKKIIKK